MSGFVNSFPGSLSNLVAPSSPQELKDAVAKVQALEPQLATQHDTLVAAGRLMLQLVESVPFGDYPVTAMTFENFHSLILAVEAKQRALADYKLAVNNWALNYTPETPLTSFPAWPSNLS